MNVASLELCKELYELSGWEDTYCSWDVSDRSDMPFESVVKSDDVTFTAVPAYDLGYLLRKLRHATPGGWAAVTLGEVNIRVHIPESKATYIDVHGEIYDQFAATPEDAAAKLAIELFKQGILTKGAA